MSSATTKSSKTAYHIVLEPSELPGVWTAFVPAFRFTTEGRGRAGAQRAAMSAIQGYVDLAAELGKPVPQSDVIEVRLPQRSKAGTPKRSTPKKASRRKTARKAVRGRRTAA